MKNEPQITGTEINQELRDLRKHVELLSYIVDHVKMGNDEWKYIGVNVAFLESRVNDLINELTNLMADIGLTRTFIEHGNYSEAKASLNAIAKKFNL